MFKFDNLNNIKQSLEDNRAHLRRQLIGKEAEINRLNVQLRNALRKCDRAQIEIDMLKENNKHHVLSKTNLEQAKLDSAASILQEQGSSSSLANSKKSTSKTQPKLVKKYFNLEEILSDPIKTKLYIDKLNIQLFEKVIHFY